MDTYSDVVGLRMEGLVMKLLHDRFAGAVPFAVTRNSPQRPIKGTVWVDAPERPSGSPIWPLDVFAALSADRKRLAISVVNPAETTQECELRFAGVQADGPAKVWRLMAPGGTPPPPPGPGGFGFGPPATMAESTLPAMPRTVALPPASISVYEFELRQI